MTVKNFENVKLGLFKGRNHINAQNFKYPLL